MPEARSRFFLQNLSVPGCSIRPMTPFNSVWVASVNWEPLLLLNVTNAAIHNVAQTSKSAVSPICKSAVRARLGSQRVWKPPRQQTWKSALRFFPHASGLRYLRLLTASYSRNVSGVFLEGSHNRFFTAQAGILHAADGLKHALVIFRHDLNKFGD